MHPLRYTLQSRLRRTVQSELVKATTPTPGRSHLTGLDRVCNFWQTSLVFTYDYPIDVPRLRTALAETLCDFPELAGRLRQDGQRYAIEWNDEGAQLSVTDAPGWLPRGRPERPLREWTGVLCDNLPARKVAKGRAPLLSLRITRYADGHTALGMAWPHAIGDGVARYAFLLDLSARMCGRTPPRRTPGTRDQLTLTAAPADDARLRRGTPTARLGTRWQNLAMIAKVLRRGRQCETANILVPGETIASLAAQARSETDERISRQDALTAAVWRAVHGGADTPLGMSLMFNARVLEELGWDRELFGNAVVSAYAEPQLGARDAVSLGQAASRVRSTYRRLDADHVRDNVSFFRRIDDDGMSDRVVVSAVARCATDAIMFNNWSKFPSYAVDMGEGGPIWFDMPRSPIPSLVVAKPHPTDPDGVDLHVTLDADRLRRVLDALGPDVSRS